MCNIKNNVFYRGYSELKIANNIDCEIFQTILMEAQESYKEEIVFELQNTTTEDMEQNLITVKQWVDCYIKDHL